MQNRVIKLSAFALLLTMLTGCELAGDIFEAGIWIGIIIVVLVVGIILWLLRKIRGRR